MFVLVAFVWILTSGPNAEACQLGKHSPWHWTKSELTQKSESILLAKVIEAKGPIGQKFGVKGWNYKFEVVEVLKGLKRTEVTLENLASPNYGQVKKVKTRVFYYPDCKIVVGFQEGKTYLLFLNSFNPYGYQEITSQSDPWLTEVRGYLGTK